MKAGIGQNMYDCRLAEGLAVEIREGFQMKLTNSNGAVFEIDPIDLIERVNKYGIDRFFHPKELWMDNPQDGDWCEYYIVPTSNGVFNPETGQEEFCTPFWDGELANVKVGKVVFRGSDGQYHYDIDLKVRDAFPGCAPRR